MRLNIDTTEKTVTIQPYQTFTEKELRSAMESLNVSDYKIIVETYQYPYIYQYPYYRTGTGTGVELVPEIVNISNTDNITTSNTSNMKYPSTNTI